MTDYTRKVLENKCRRWAARQGLQLVKVRQRDPRAADYGHYKLIAAEDTAEDTDGIFTVDPARRAREMTQYGRDELPRAAALVHAFIVHDVRAIHALGPAEADDRPTGWGFDYLEYKPTQRKNNPDHDLIFALVQMIIDLARESGTPPRDLYRFLDQFSPLPGTAGEVISRAEQAEAARLVAEGDLFEIERKLLEGSAR